MTHPILTNPANARYGKNQTFTFTKIHHQSKTNATSHTLCEKNLSMQNSKRFHCGLFEVEILEIFTIAFLLEVIIGT